MGAVLKGSADHLHQPLVLRAMAATPMATKHLNSQHADQEVMAVWDDRTVGIQCLPM